MLHYLYFSIWLLLQVLAACYERLRWLLLQLQSIYHKSYDLLNSARKTQIHHDLAFLERCKQELSKIPHHLNIIVGPNESLNKEQFSRIVLYALNMNIDCISLYDTRSVVSAAPSKKGCEIALVDLQPPKFVSSTQLQQHRCRWSMHTSSEVPLVNGKHKTKTNGIISNGTSASNNFKSTAEKSIEIVMLSAKDGRPLIAEVCRELYQQRKSTEIQGLLQNRNHLMERISVELSRKLNKMPDPELSIVFNRHTCTFGLLPWQTRFTEFHTIETGRYFNVETFARVLYKYSRCEQRWGK